MWTCLIQVDEDLIAVEGSNEGLHAVVEHQQHDEDEAEAEDDGVEAEVGEEHIPFAATGVTKTTTFVTGIFFTLINLIISGTFSDWSEQQGLFRKPGLIHFKGTHVLFKTFDLF